MSRARRSRISVEIPGNPELYISVVPPGWEVIGVVTDAEGAGALVRNRDNGVYCRINAGALRSLPQRKIQAALASYKPHEVSLD